MRNIALPEILTHSFVGSVSDFEGLQLVKFLFLLHIDDWLNFFALVGLFQGRVVGKHFASVNPIAVRHLL